MHRFLIPIIIFSIASWSAASYMVFFTPPQSDSWVLLFLSALFLSVEITSGLIIYAVRAKFLPSWRERREVLRESLKLSLPCSLGVFLFLFLRYFTMDSKFNLAILFLLLISLGVYIIRKL